MGKTLRNLVLAGTILASSLFPSKVSPKEYYVTNSSELETALADGVPEGETKYITLADGDYLGSESGTTQIKMNDTELIGENNPIPIYGHPVTEIPRAETGTRIKAGIEATGNSSLRNLILNSEGFYNVWFRPVQGQTETFDVENVYFENNSLLGSKIFLWGHDANLNVDNCIFNNENNAGIVPYFSGENLAIKVRDSLFFKSLQGVRLETLGTLDLGKDDDGTLVAHRNQSTSNLSILPQADYGNNSFIKNEFNLDIREQPEVVNAVGNYWTDKDGNYLTTAGQIYNTILIHNLSSAFMPETIFYPKELNGLNDDYNRKLPNVDVIPFMTLPTPSPSPTPNPIYYDWGMVVNTMPRSIR